jgi:hypothetical protein
MACLVRIVLLSEKGNRIVFAAVLCRGGVCAGVESPRRARVLLNFTAYTELHSQQTYTGIRAAALHFSLKF